MGINVSTIDKKYDFEIESASYAGKPVDHTVMFITKKVEHLLNNLIDVNYCLVYVDKSIDVLENLRTNNCFVFTENPQGEYAKFTAMLLEERTRQNANKKYRLTEDGYYIGENVTIGEGTVIEPNCIIDHDVKIGKNSKILSGANIKNAIIGDCFIAGENATIGTDGFTMAEDENGNKFRISTLGKVVIGNHVEIGPMTNVGAGTAGNTVFEDYVKIDALVHIGHDVHLKKNVEITAGSVIGGFVEIGEHGYVGIKSVLRNRITVGDGAFIGMGAVVTKNVAEGITVVGNPAKPFEK